MIGWGSHLHDDRLFDCYRRERIGEAVDPPSARASGGLPALRRTITTSCHGSWTRCATEADAELDDVYSADHLRAQQQQIAHRIEHVGRSARVSIFRPTRAPGTCPPPAREWRRAGWPPPPPPGCLSASVSACSSTRGGTGAGRSGARRGVEAGAARAACAAGDRRSMSIAKTCSSPRSRSRPIGRAPPNSPPSTR